jgi:hypothetical protein
VIFGFLVAAPLGILFGLFVGLVFAGLVVPNRSRERQDREWRIDFNRRHAADIAAGKTRPLDVPY